MDLAKHDDTERGEGRKDKEAEVRREEKQDEGDETGCPVRGALEQPLAQQLSQGEGQLRDAA